MPEKENKNMLLRKFPRRQLHEEQRGQLRPLGEAVEIDEFIGRVNLVAARTERIDAGQAGGGEAVAVAGAAGGAEGQVKAQVLSTSGDLLHQTGHARTHNLG